MDRSRRGLLNTEQWPRKNVTRSLAYAEIRHRERQGRIHRKPPFQLGGGERIRTPDLLNQWLPPSFLDRSLSGHLATFIRTPAAGSGAGLAVDVPELAALGRTRIADLSAKIAQSLCVLAATGHVSESRGLAALGVTPSGGDDRAKRYADGRRQTRASEGPVRHGCVHCLALDS